MGNPSTNVTQLLFCCPVPVQPPESSYFWVPTDIPKDLTTFPWVPSLPTFCLALCHAAHLLLSSPHLLWAVEDEWLNSGVKPAPPGCLPELPGARRTMALNIWMHNIIFMVINQQVILEDHFLLMSPFDLFRMQSCRISSFKTEITL